MVDVMIPIRTSSIFQSRWLALAWAAGIIWIAYDFASPSEEPANADDNRVQITDASGAPVSPEEARRLEEVVKGL